MLGEVDHGKPELDRDLLTVMFLNLDLKRVRTGVENAALLRATMFERHLGIVPQFLTVNYHPYFAEVHSELRTAGSVSESLVFRNMYDFFQEADWDAEARKSKTQSEPLGATGWRSVKVGKTPDTRVYDATNQVILYQKRSRQTGVLEYVNYFHQKKKWRRDSYATGGWLSRIQLLDYATEEPLYEHYLRPDGSVALIQWFTGCGKERQLVKAQLISREGFCVQEWRDQAGMVTHWLRAITSDARRRYVMISDRSRVYYRPLRELKRERGNHPHFVVIPVIHAVHIQNGFNVMHSKTNTNHAAILEDLAAPNAVVVLTERQRQDIVRRYGPGNLQVIAHPYEPRGQPSRFEDRDRFLVVYLARYSAEKNQALAIRAFANVVRSVPEARLRLFGHGSGKAELQELVKRLKLEEIVQVNDFVQDVPAVYESAGLSLLTSQGEGYPLVVVESLSHGCPMIAFDVNYGPSEIIDDGETGFLVPFKDESLLAERIITLLRDPERQRRMSDAARNASSRFRMAAVAEKWRALLASMTKLKESAMTLRQAVGTGATIRAAHSILDQMGLGEIGRIDFDWQQNGLVLSSHETISLLNSEASQALESVLRVLKISVCETPPTATEPRSSADAATDSRTSFQSTMPTATNSADRESRWPTGAAGATASTTRQTDRLRELLLPLFAELRVTRLLDVGCGDVHWIHAVAFDGHLHYLGVDIDEALIEQNRRRFGTGHVCSVGHAQRPTSARTFDSLPRWFGASV